MYIYIYIELDHLSLTRGVLRAKRRKWRKRMRFYDGTGVVVTSPVFVCTIMRNVKGNEAEEKENVDR